MSMALVQPLYGRYHIETSDQSIPLLPPLSQNLSTYTLGTPFLRQFQALLLIDCFFFCRIRYSSHLSPQTFFSKWGQWFRLDDPFVANLFLKFQSLKLWPKHIKIFVQCSNFCHLWQLTLFAGNSDWKTGTPQSSTFQLMTVFGRKKQKRNNWQTAVRLQ